MNHCLQITARETQHGQKISLPVKSEKSRDPVHTNAQCSFSSKKSKFQKKNGMALKRYGQQVQGATI